MCYVVVRKLDPYDCVLLWGHLVVNLDACPERPRNFTVGIMSNEEVKARSMLNSMLGAPPSFHKRSEVRLVERRWRSNPDAVMRFLADVVSATAQFSSDPRGRAYTLKFSLPPGMMGKLRHNLGTWW